MSRNSTDRFHGGRVTGPGLTAISLLLILAVEFVLRLVAPDASDLRAYLDRSLHYTEPCADRVSQVGGDRIVQRPGGANFNYPFDRKEAVLRIAVVGESTGAFLGDALAHFAQNDGTEILNCAMPGSSFEHLQARWSEVSTYRPDVVVIVFGHNITFRYPAERWLLRLWSLAARSRLLALALPSDHGTPDEEQLQRRITAYRSWLEHVIGSTQRLAPQVILTTLPSNLWVPTVDAVGCGEDIDVLAATFDWYAGRQQQAIERLEATVKRTGQLCQRFRLATMLRRAGRLSEASQQVSHLRNSPYWAEDRAPAAVNEVVRALAEERGVALLDLERRATERAPAATPGWEQMRDHCHLDEPNLAAESLGITAMARQLLNLAALPQAHDIEAYAGVPSFGPALETMVASYRDTRPPQAERWLTPIPHIIETWSHRPHGPSDADLRTFVESRLKQLEPDQRRGALVVLAIAEGLWHSDRRAEALSLNLWAQRRNIAEAWLQRAYFDLATRPAAAAQSAARALELAPASTAAADLVRRLAHPDHSGPGEGVSPGPPVVDAPPSAGSPSTQE